MKSSCKAATPTSKAFLQAGPCAALAMALPTPASVAERVVRISGLSNRARPGPRAPRFDKAVFKVAGDAKQAVIEIKVAR